MLETCLLHQDLSLSERNVTSFVLLNDSLINTSISYFPAWSFEAEAGLVEPLGAFDTPLGENGELGTWPKTIETGVSYLPNRGLKCI